MKNLSFLIVFIILSNTIYSQSSGFMDAQNQARADLRSMPNHVQYNSARNIYVDDNQVIHIFLFEDGNLLLAGYPTTGTEKNKYQVHLYLTAANNDNYLLEYSGSYTPVLNIQNSGIRAFRGAIATVKRLDFAVIGPFTNTLQLTLKVEVNNIYTALTTTTIQISKTIHASIGSALIYSFLKNPSNIRKIPLTNGSGDSTLIADDIGGRGMLTLMATFYPWGRNNLMMPEWNFKDRIGIVVGTSIASGASNFEDVFVGASYDFSIGGSIVAGLHYGRRQRIAGVDYKDFEFGETVYADNLEERKYMDWNYNFFFGVQIDSRIFSQIFK